MPSAPPPGPTALLVVVPAASGGEEVVVLGTVVVVVAGGEVVAGGTVVVVAAVVALDGAVVVVAAPEPLVVVVVPPPVEVEVGRGTTGLGPRPVHGLVVDVVGPGIFARVVEVLVRVWVTGGEVTNVFAVPVGADVGGLVRAVEVGGALVFAGFELVGGEEGRVVVVEVVPPAGPEAPEAPEARGELLDGAAELAATWRAAARDA
jgi:hypothetical protein